MKRILSLIALIVWATVLFAQDQTVKGKVISKSDGQPIPGVSVSVKGTTTGTITNIDGEYNLNAPSGSKLVFSFIGMRSQEVVPAFGVADITLADDVANLNEVVVVGYGVQKKSLVTGAIAKVNGEELTKSTDGQVTHALQGKTPGVVINSNSGQPGDKVSIRVRGVGTNGNSEPLYVVDGMPTSQQGTDYLNSSDIESIEVLKDAASCAIYGARGANGVVIITTKGGKKDSKMTISYDGYYGVQNTSRKLDLMNSDQYMMMVDESLVNGGSPKFFTDAQKAKYPLANTNWQNEMFYKNAPKQNHSISMTGGSDKLAFSSSINYFQQDGIVAKGKSNYEKYSYRINVDADFGFLKVNTNINLVNAKTIGIDANNLQGGGLIQAANMPPVVPVYNADGTWATPEQYEVSTNEITNPVAMLSYRNSKKDENKAVYGISGLFDFGHLNKMLKGLSFKTSYSGDYALVNNDNYTPIYSLDATHFEPMDKVGKSHDMYTGWIFENVLSYDKKLDVHHFTIIAGSSATENKWNSLTASKNDLIIKDAEHAYINNAQNNASTIAGGDVSDHTVASLFSRLNYDYNDKYMLTGTVRRDGSSRFGSENKYGIFPSASVGWVISNEEFMKGHENVIDMIKLRASWGQNGNEDFGNNSDFRYTSVMANNKYYYLGNTQVQYNGSIPSSLANPSLKWETSEQLNVGLDYVGLMGRFHFSGDYYIKTTKDWLITAPIPYVVGNSAPVVNGGAVENKGLELELGWKDKVSKVGYSVSINGAFNKNNVTEINNTEKRISGGTGGFQQDGILIITPGQALGSFYGLKTDGVFQNQAQIDAYTYVDDAGVTKKIQPNAKPGDFKFVDTDGNGIIDKDKDRQVLGSPYPTFTGALNLSVDAYGFDLNAMLYTALGQKVWDATRRFDKINANYTTDWLNRWTGEGSTNEYPRVTSSDLNGNLQNPSDFYVKDASYVRLKVVTLGYTFPKVVTSMLKVNRIRLYVSGENLVTFTNYKGYDPEIGGDVYGYGIDHGVYPQPITVLGGVNVTF